MITETHHKIIEASAGTGKTWRICEETVQMIKDGIPLEQILIMTYTEQATGELRQRIRERIEQAIQASKDQDANMLRALLSFESSSIFTIHGFCNSVLKEYAFEAGIPLTQILENSSDKLDTFFFNQLRNKWPESYLDILDDEKKDRLVSKEYHKKEILQITQRMQSSDRFCRPYSQALAEVCQKAIDVFDDSLIAQIQSLTTTKNGQIHSSTKRSLLTKTIDVKNALLRWKETQDDSLLRLCFSEPSKIREYRERLAGKTDYHLLSEDQLGLLQEMQTILKASEFADVIQESALKLKQDITRDKRKNGTIDFDDMLIQVRDALKKSPLLKSTLQSRYRVALVDEFQDTDPTQWEIIRTLFTEDEHHSLVIVGDPKQAIYGFRGANIETYRHARIELQNRSSQIENLDINFRSIPSLIQSANSLFGDSWFKKSNMEYANVYSPDTRNIPRKTLLFSDKSGRPPLCLIHLNEKEALKARRRWAIFISQEIQRLLQSDVRISTEGSNGRPLDLADICILIRSRTSDLKPLQSALRKLNIPYTFSRQAGLFQSNECQQLDILLQALAFPEDQNAFNLALLTNFFSLDLSVFENYLSIMGNHPILQSMGKWKEIALKHKWAIFFTSIYEDTGILARELQKENGERIITNYMQLAEILTEDAMHENLDIAALAARLEEYMHRTFSDDDSRNMHRLETEQKKAQIMTMHASKGLQFPVVFIMGGISGLYNSIPLYYDYTEDTGRVFDLACSLESCKKMEMQEQAEEERLLYVALTRAQYRVYAPVWRQNENDDSGRIYVINSASHPVYSLPNIYSTNPEHEDDTPDSNNLPQLPDNYIQSFDPEPETRASAQVKAIREDALLPCEIPDARQRIISVSSFSSLAGRIHYARTMLDREYGSPDMEFEVNTGGSLLSIPKEIDEDDMPDDAAEISSAEPGKRTPSAQILLSGKKGGVILHSMLEKVDFSDVYNAVSAETIPDSTISSLKDILKSEGVMDEASHAWALEVIWNTMHTPLPERMNSVCIGQITERLQEMPFWIYAPEISDFHLPGLNANENFLTGIMDMAAKINGKYYIFDWKSNYSENGYSLDELERIMLHHQYHLQGRIYAMALIKWLKETLGEDFSYERDFGGACYVFLRGLNGKDGNTGIYFWKDTMDQIESLTNILKDARSACEVE
jgi:exodeoxyribonuclease V beta subunit